ncbi:YndJ family transporter [Symmachiella macrocystis]|uniref:YndJ family transporter n=1 Tax=Symmachiella macrocystis TaxID=2527985 RepID=UPI0018D4B344|nr:YndJ family transporter [Symmachiella macrocystis]
MLAVVALSMTPEPFEMRWAAGLFLLAPLVLMPLALPLTTVTMSSKLISPLWITLWRIQFPAATLVAISFTLPTGTWAGLMAVPWLLTTGLIALIGLLDFDADQNRSLERLCSQVAMLYLPIGGVATVMTRSELTVFGFSDIIILATAVHFHYAGFILLILAGQVIRHRPGKIVRVATALALFGIPALATGITLSRFNYLYPEWLAAVGLSVVAMIIAWGQCRVAVRKFCGVRRSLLLISGLSLIAGMCMSILFAAGVFRGVHLLGIDIPWMLRYHAVINAFGFALCGVCGWHFVEQQTMTEHRPN